MKPTCLLNHASNCERNSEQIRVIRVIRVVRVIVNTHTGRMFSYAVIVGVLGMIIQL